MDSDRAEIVRLAALATGDEKHEASSYSTLDALLVAYRDVLRVDPSRPAWEDRDRFFLSKGHGPAAFYAVLAWRGFFPEDWLPRFITWGGKLGGASRPAARPGCRGVHRLAGPRTADGGRQRPRASRPGPARATGHRPHRRRGAQRGLELGGGDAGAAPRPRQPDPARDRQPLEHDPAVPDRRQAARIRLGRCAGRRPRPRSAAPRAGAPLRRPHGGGRGDRGPADGARPCASRRPRR